MAGMCLSMKENGEDSRNMYNCEECGDKMLKNGSSYGSTLCHVCNMHSQKNIIVISPLKEYVHIPTKRLCRLVSSDVTIDHSKQKLGISFSVEKRCEESEAGPIYLAQRHDIFEISDSTKYFSAEGV